MKLAASWSEDDNRRSAANARHRGQQTPKSHISSMPKRTESKYGLTVAERLFAELRLHCSVLTLLVVTLFGSAQAPSSCVAQNGPSLCTGHACTCSGRSGTSEVSAPLVGVVSFVRCPLNFRQRRLWGPILRCRASTPLIPRIRCCDRPIARGVLKKSSLGNQNRPESCFALAGMVKRGVGLLHRRYFDHRLDAVSCGNSNICRVSSIEPG